MACRCFESPHLLDRRADYQYITRNVDTTARGVDCNLVKATPFAADCPELGNRNALEQECDEQRRTTSQNDSADHSNSASKAPYNEYAPVEEEDPNFDHVHSKRPE